MNSILGLDIGSHSIKLVELAREHNSIKLLTAGSCITPPKTLSSNLAADTESLAIAIKKLLVDTGAKSRTVNIALPESQVFTRVIEMPSLSSRELNSALQWEAEQYIPLPLSEVNVDYSILRDSKSTGTNKMEVLLVACPKTLLEKYVNFLELAGLSISNVETEIISLSRSLQAAAGKLSAVLVVALGAQTTDLAIMREGVITFTRSISAGGNAMSRALAQTLGLEPSQAEEFKKTYGFESDKMESKLITAMAPIMDTIVGEIKRSIAFFVEKHPGETLKVVLLSGGTAKTPGLVKHLAEKIGNVEIQLVNPWVGITKDVRFNVLDGEGPTFAVAVGLALR